MVSSAEFSQAPPFRPDLFSVFLGALLSFDPFSGRYANLDAVPEENGEWFCTAEVAARALTACVHCHAKWKGQDRR
jgi:hypothetical protein